MKKVYSTGSRAASVNVYYNTESKEYIAQLSIENVLQSASDYHCSDKQDAIDTANAMVQRVVDNNNKQAKQATAEPATAEPATAEDKLFNAVNSLSTEEFDSLCNRLSLKQLETVQKLFSERAKAELHKSEKEVLSARKMELSELNIKAMNWLLQQPETTAEELKTLKPIYFDNSFNMALAAVQPATDKTGRPAKHNDLSHQVKLLITRFSYQKEANCDNFNVRPVQNFEPLTLNDFTVHCQKNTFANNTVYPVTIDGKQFADKQSAVEAMAELMFNWYKSAVKVGA